MMKLTDIQSPILAGVVREKSKLAAIAGIKNCLYGGATMVDLHMSCLENTDVDTLREIINCTKLPILALNYNTYADWTFCNFSEEERVAMYMRALEAGTAGIDMQGYTFDEASRQGFVGEDKYSFTSGNPKEIVTNPAIIAKQCELIETTHSYGAQVLLSCHPGKAMDSRQVVDLALFLEKRNPDIIKIVTPASTQEELEEGIRAMMLLKHEVKTKVSYHMCGKMGMLSRIVNPILGGEVVFCVDGYNETATMEQLDLRTAKAIIDNIHKIV